MELWIKTVDFHTNGQPFRIIVETSPKIEFAVDANLLDKRRFLMEESDLIRKLTMREPRGHDGMYGGLLTKPDVSKKVCDIAIIFIDNDTYSTMCGHGTMATVRYAIEIGIVPKIEPETSVCVQVPCGIVKAYAEVQNGKLTGRVRILAPKGYLHARDQAIIFEGVTVKYDIGFGGAFYAIITANDLGIDLETVTLQKISNVGLRFKKAVAASNTIRSQDSIQVPTNFLFFYGVIFADQRLPSHIDKTLKHVIVFGEGQVDRSPCGSGTTARLSALANRKLISTGQTVEFINPLTGQKSTFFGKIISTNHKKVRMGSEKVNVENGVKCEIEGKTYCTGDNTFRLQEDDIFPEGLALNS